MVPPVEFGLFVVVNCTSYKSAVKRYILPAPVISSVDIIFPFQYAAYCIASTSACLPQCIASATHRYVQRRRIWQASIIRRLHADAAKLATIQAVHNLVYANHAIRDPSLTEQGISTCASLARDFPYHDTIDAIFVSPLRRAIYTAVHTFRDNPRLRTGELKIIALPLIQETTNVPCDTGSSVADLKAEFEKNQTPVDLSLCEEDWYVKVCELLFLFYSFCCKSSLALQHCG